MNPILNVIIKIGKYLLRILFFLEPDILIKSGLYLKFISWKRKNHNILKISDRYTLHEYLNANIINNKPIDYLEFGVEKGASFKHWLKINTNPSSNFYGFDSFDGLPKKWIGYNVGSFTTDGNIPMIEDKRAHFIKGLFQDTLYTFLKNYSPKNRLVVHLDSDLYSSTLYVLMMLDHLFDHNTIIIFDEFCILNHEFRAYLDYRNATGRNLETLVQTEKLGQIAFKIDANKDI